MSKTWIFITAFFVLMLLLSASAAEQARVVRLRAEMTTTELFLCGIGKLTEAELVNLEIWFYQRYTDPKWQENRPTQLEAWKKQREAVKLLPADSAPTAGSANDSQVVLNTRSLVIHSPGCRYVKSCTKNCIAATRSSAEARGGRPCSYCRGGF